MTIKRRAKLEGNGISSKENVSGEIQTSKYRCSEDEHHTSSIKETKSASESNRT
jgi:hypothetical protein